ncbi:MAG TPA: M23 family metallopeptidase, partial [Gemmatimonadaceae bacterium]|nr:M23 family metallopeptidase [Gemmatimonadaceae bacterium]
MHHRPLLAAAAALLLPPASAARAQSSAPTHSARALAVTLSPARPVRGRLFTVRVANVPDAGTLAATIAGEPLHFVGVAGAKAGTRGGGATALAAIPIDAPDTLPLTIVRAAAGGRADTTLLRVAVAPGNYKVERITVAPEFGREPDSALAARIARENAQAREIGVRSHETPRLWRAPFTLPRPGRVTSGFGTARTFNGAVQSRHMGVDFAGKVGAPIRAANRGVVALVANFYLAGTAVYVDHGGGLVTGYFHMSKPLVAAGDT